MKAEDYQGIGHCSYEIHYLVKEGLTNRSRPPPFDLSLNNEKSNILAIQAHVDLHSVAGTLNEPLDFGTN
jgi:hypothetical protein